MAKLSNNQQARQIEREKAKQEALKKKIEVQQKKELYGESWKIIEQKKAIQDIEFEIGSALAPQIYDSKDLYDFFDVVAFYRDEENKSLKMDFNKYLESESKYNKAIQQFDEDLANYRKENKEEDDEEVIAENLLVDDGVNEEDLQPPAISEQSKKASNNPVAMVKGRLHKISSMYFNRYVPILTRYNCSCCGRPKKLNNFYNIYDISCISRIDNKGTPHMHVCKECVQKMFAYYYQECDKNAEEAMKKICASLNIYWEPDLFQTAKNKYEDGDRRGTLIGEYLKVINFSAPGMTFMDSPFLKGTEEKHEIIDRIDDAPLDWSKEDAKNKKDIIRILGYDPFEYEENEEDKKILYADLAAIIDEDIQQDYVKMQSALTIVKSFTKVRHLDEKAYFLEKNKASLAEQKNLADLKAKELKAISDFSRDSGFSERFKTRQSQGQTSFTGIVKTMNEKKYENELINKYDIQTSSTIQAAADASFRSIFNQLNLSEAEAFKIAADQLEELRKVKKENEKLTEDLRLAKYEIAELNLKEKAREKGIIEDA